MQAITKLNRSIEWMDQWHIIIYHIRHWKSLIIHVFFFAREKKQKRSRHSLFLHIFCPLSPDILDVWWCLDAGHVYHVHTGYLTVRHGKIHPFLSSVNHLFLWAMASMAMLVITRWCHSSVLCPAEFGIWISSGLAQAGINWGGNIHLVWALTLKNTNFRAWHILW